MMEHINWVEGLGWYAAFLMSVVLHEAAHAWSAWKLGDRTAYLGGQVTLDPVPHIRREPFGMVIIPLASFLIGGWMVGWGSTPYDPNWALSHPKRSAWMALAGPAANLALMILAGFIMRIGLIAGLFVFNETGFHAAANLSWLAGIATFVSILFLLNLILLIFNLLPVPPLDGSALPLLGMDRNMAHRYMTFIYNPNMRWLGIIIAWNVFGSIFNRIAPVVMSWVLG